MRALIFPGQGTQVVGMGKKLAAVYPEARRVFEEVDDVLNKNLSHIMFEGPENELMLTENAQPAIMATSLAILRVMSVTGGFDVASEVRCVAGHSLGEYSALAAVGTFSLRDAARLLQLRGRAMQDAVPVGEGAMAAFIGVSLNDAEEIAKEASSAGVCDFANDNAPGQVVVSGSKVSVQKAIEVAKQRGAKRAILLPVSAPFHSSLMSLAADQMKAHLGEVSMAAPVVPVVSNVIARELVDVDQIRKLLVEQVTARVRWRESIMVMQDAGVNELIEVGTGKVLSGLARRVDRSLLLSNVDTPEDVVAFFKS